MLDLRVTGAEDLAALSTRLRAAGSDGKGLRKELLKGIRTAAGGPMRKATRAAWRSEAPKRGGLARQGLRMTVRTNTRNGDSLGVRLVTGSSKGYSMADMDSGRLRHPVFGNPEVWADQQIPAGIISRAQEGAAPQVRQEILRAIADIARRVEG